MFHFESLPKDTFSTTLKALKFIALSEGVAQINEYGSPIHWHWQSLTQVTTFCYVTPTSALVTITLVK